jgi:hypothetical protein
MSNIEDLRQMLFESIRAVRNGELDTDSARTINDLSKTLVDTAKVEIDHIRAVGNGESAFIQPTTPGLPSGITSIVRHRIA